MGDGKDIEIAGQTIGESTKISLSVKTALWIVGGVIALFSTLFSLAYADIKSDVKQYKETVDKEKTEYFDKVRDALDTEVGKMRDKNDDMIKDIDDIKGNVKVILDRTSGVRNIEVTNSPVGTPPPPPTKIK